MRRKDREVTNKQEIISILERCFTCRVAVADGDFPYIIPMNYGVKTEEGHIILYFHGAAEGKKNTLFALNPHVGFEVDRHEAYKPGSLTSQYESAVGHGILSVVTQAKEKAEALRIITEHYEIEYREAFSECIAMTNVLRLDVQEITGKRNSP